MKLYFTKMHGLGNDFVFIDLRKTADILKGTDIENLSRLICDRHHGIGADGLVLVDDSSKADIRFTIYNSDGSRAKMCGNAIRCLSWYIYEKSEEKKTSLRVETDSGIVCPSLIPDKDGINHMIKVDMGKPEFSPLKIPCISEKNSLFDEPIETSVGLFRFSAVSMGNPHAVIFTDELENIDIEKIGRSVENHPIFPEKTNTEFVRIISENEIEMRVWERGAGETMACGTGACAAAVVCIASKGAAKKVTVRLAGGSLEIEWDGKDGSVFMTGPATHVFEGEIVI